MLVLQSALVDIMDLSKVSWSGRGCFYTSSGLGLRMVKDLDPWLAPKMFERREYGSLHRWGVDGSNLGQTQS